MTMRFIIILCVLLLTACTSLPRDKSIKIVADHKDVAGLQFVTGYTVQESIIYSALEVGKIVADGELAQNKWHDITVLVEFISLNGGGTNNWAINIYK